MVENLGDSQQQFSVDGTSLENLIDIGTVAAQLAGKPADAALLPFQLFLDETANMNPLWP